MECTFVFSVSHNDLVETKVKFPFKVRLNSCLVSSLSLRDEPGGRKGNMEFSQPHFFLLLMTCQSECTYVLKEQRGHIDPVISLCPC